MLTGDLTNHSKSGTRYWRPLSLLVLIVLGIILFYVDIFDWEYVYQLSQHYTQNWWVAIALIALQVLLFTFALPGSVLLWLVALMYTPITATLMLVAGSTLGALSAYWFARRQSLAWTTHVQHSRFFHLLETRGNFFTLSALRVFPGFPHSIINYGAGILHLPIGQFLGASIIGFTLKYFLYTSAVHGAVMATDLSDAIRLEILWPMIVLALLFVLAAFLHRHWTRTHIGN